MRESDPISSSQTPGPSSEPCSQQLLTIFPNPILHQLAISPRCSDRLNASSNASISPRCQPFPSLSYVRSRRLLVLRYLRFSLFNPCCISHPVSCHSHINSVGATNTTPLYAMPKQRAKPRLPHPRTSTSSLKAAHPPKQPPAMPRTGHRPSLAPNPPLPRHLICRLHLPATTPIRTSAPGSPPLPRPWFPSS